MNKRDTEKLMRQIAWNVCMLNEVPQQRDFDVLEADGYKLERMSMAGMDGLAVSKDGERVSYIAVPRKRNPGKKQTCTMYTWRDVWKFSKADAALADGDVAGCMSYLAGIESVSLHNEICEGLERNYQEKLNAGKSACDEHAKAAVEAEAIHADEPEQAEGHDEPAPILDELDQVRAMLGNPKDVEVSRKREGACIWAIGNTQPMKELLKSLGFRWAPKRQGWYWKPQAA